MCNAYGLRAPVHLIAEAVAQAGVALGFEGGAAPNLEARDDIRPTETAAVVAPARPLADGAKAGGSAGGGVEPPRRAAVLLQRRWGFAPARPPAGAVAGGAGKPRSAGPVINFRSEGRRFRTGERVLVMASHFFEFTGTRYPKTRWRFTKPGPGDGADEDPFAIAGLLRPGPVGPDAPRTSAGEPWPESWTMLTVDPGPDVAPIHDRQVVVLDRADWARWLWGTPEEAQALLRPSPAGTLRVMQDAR